MQPVLIYTTQFCPFCLRAKQLLKSKAVEYEEIAVDFDPALRREMTQKAGGFSTVPQIWIGGQHVGGCNELYMLERAGKLDGLLQGNETN
jgi:glutaredoxin 3